MGLKGNDMIKHLESKFNDCKYQPTASQASGVFEEFVSNLSVSPTSASKFPKLASGLWKHNSSLPVHLWQEESPSVFCKRVASQWADHATRHRESASEQPREQSGRLGGQRPSEISTKSNLRVGTCLDDTCPMTSNKTGTFTYIYSKMHCPVPV